MFIIYSLHLKVSHSIIYIQSSAELSREQRSWRSYFIIPCPPLLAHSVTKYSQINKQVITKPPKWLFIPVNLMTACPTGVQTQQGLNRLCATWQNEVTRVTFRMCKRLKSIQHGNFHSAFNHAGILRFRIWRDKVCGHKSLCCISHCVFLSSAMQQVRLVGGLQPIDQMTKAGGNVSLKHAGASNNSCWWQTECESSKGHFIWHGRKWQWL